MRYWLILCLVLAGPVLAGNAETDKKLEQIRKEIAELQEFLNKAQDEQKKLVQNLRQSDEEVARISKQVEQLRRALEEERSRLKKLQTEQAALTSEKESQAASLSDLIRATYALGREPQFKVLFSQQNPAAVSRSMTYLGYLSQAHQQKLDTYQLTLHNLAQVEQEISAREISLNEKLKTLFNEQQNLINQRKQQQKDARALNQQIKISGKSLQRKQQDRARLQQVVKKVSGSIPQGYSYRSNINNDSQLPLSKLKGKLPAPLTGRAENRFGSMQDNGKQRWEGVVFNAHSGDQVRAVHHGRVVFANWLRGYGLLIIVDHGQGYMSLYGRNQELMKSIGDWVEPGEVIASAGRSGGYDDDGLYFELRRNGEPVNPEIWLARR
jgi:murein hydrolase activator